MQMHVLLEFLWFSFKESVLNASKKIKQVKQAFSVKDCLETADVICNVSDQKSAE